MIHLLELHTHTCGGAVCTLHVYTPPRRVQPLVACQMLREEQEREERTHDLGGAREPKLVLRETDAFWTALRVNMSLPE